MKKKRTSSIHVRKVVSYILAFFIAVFLWAALCAVSLWVGLFAKQEFRNTVMGEAYFEDVHASITERFRAEYAEYGLPGSFVEETLTLERVRSDGAKVIDRMIADTTAKTTYSSDDYRDKFVSEVEEDFQKDMEQYLEAENLKGDKTAVQISESLVKEAPYIYFEEMRFPLVEQYLKYYRACMPGVRMILIVSGVLLVICSLAVVTMYRRRYHGLRFVFYGVVSGTWLNLMSTLYIRRNFIYNESGMLSDGYRATVDGFITKSMNQGVIISGIGVLLALVLIVCIYNFKKQDK
ncbi:MAG: hypothetical protein K6G65_04285 [Lachnospiraceae bacterium]|nr:hypothetical protein [Lachnospiraceae bacterium]